jgi:hypothetical protein
MPAFLSLHPVSSRLSAIRRRATDMKEFTTPDAVSLAFSLAGLAVCVGAAAVKFWRIYTADAFRVTNRQTGKSAIVSSRSDSKVLLDVLNG